MKKTRCTEEQIAFIRENYPAINHKNRLSNTTMTEVKNGLLSTQKQGGF